MSSIVNVNGNRFEERNGKLFLNGKEIIDNKITQISVEREVGFFCLGFAVCALIAVIINNF
ncbi:hypothetical protein KO527_05070 [Pseudoalteromonas sp. C2R02]|uniref:hypothetical protein n=1 Tax=Pseudoalteromonas sp. C2R02 TaxID=2841565 RepID=UPI001C08BCA1|nr:hypothetical protein [Pseudoalteromonas sp. C2R02]MBU2968718.1 hypothetical protein [Pseudoalteromonas sp. C2R02]